MEQSELKRILESHALWLKDEGGERANLGGANLGGANLGGANLYGANLGGANLRSANLRGVSGNMLEIKSAQFDQWPVTWTAEILQIGCQRHPLSMWRKADPRWIAAMDSQATAWWAKYGTIVLSLIDASPAAATGKENV